MSFLSEQNIAAFIQLLNNRSSLFSSGDLAELEQLITTLPDDNEKISREISIWYETKPKIMDAQLKLLQKIISQIDDRAPGSDKGHVPKSDPNINKQTLENAIKRSSNSENKNQGNL
jgi:hypothetical protein